MPEIRLAVRQLVEFLLQTGDIDSRFTGFDRANEGARIHRRLQKQAGEGYRPEVFLSETRTVEGISYTIEGRADGIFEAPPGRTVVDEIKTTAAPLEEITEELNFCHWAQGMVYAAIYAGQNSLAMMDVRLTYYQIDTDKILYFTRHFTRDELENFFTGLLRQYAPWARRQLDWAARRDADLAALRFPYPDYRPGQRALAGEVYRACRTGRGAGKAGARLFCQAPTGTGKTMSALFPAMKAMGEGNGEKLFYFTARTTARAAAEDAVQLLRRANPGLAFRAVTLTAKEKVCLCPGEGGRPACLPESCPYARGYYDRRKDALADLLDGAGQFDRPAIEQAARRHTVCPFELGLDLSDWSDLVIGDYNYLFDPTVRLRRFFEASGGDWVFLIDEAHNLPDRAREMYSAAFSKRSITEAKRALLQGRNSLKGRLARADKELLALRRACEGLAPRRGAPAGEGPAPAVPPPAAQLDLLGGSDGSADEGRARRSAAPLPALPPPIYAGEGTVFFRELPAAVLQPLQGLQGPLQDWLEKYPEDPAHEVLLDLSFQLQDLLRIADRYDEHYVTQLTAHGSDLDIRLLCLDPSAFVDESLACGRASVLFSATLVPPGYYKKVLGCAGARAVALNSPFPPGNLGLYCLPGISTRYRDREASVGAVSDALAALAGGRVGNYLAFFPSYAYLQKVYADFTARYPAVRTIAQESGLDEAGRAAFLEQFAPDPAGTLLGFGVLGGVFGEGVDLAGSRLIGCAIVGVGLPQVNPRQEMLRRYFDEQAGCGFDYAYRYPGMNKVLQAAGRVIRTETDRGVVLLLDDRFAQESYRRLFPPHWGHLAYLPDAAGLRRALDAFWAGGAQNA